MRLVLLPLLAAALYGADYDLVVMHARIVDGNGNPWYRGNIAVKNGRIAAGRTAGGSNR